MLENRPDLWRDSFPVKTGGRHKYDYGHAIIYGAQKLTGATRLAAEACARIGAGLTTVIAPEQTGCIYRTALPPHIMVRDDPAYHDERITARLYGPGGLGAVPDFTCKIPTVLDAEAIYDLPDMLGSHYILTPHEGEFSKAWPEVYGSKAERAIAAAQETQAHIVLKGPETVIAAPEGRVAVNMHTSPYLATAGTGDILAGMITGLLAQGMKPFEAACAAVWLHGACGIECGPGLVASDIADRVPNVLKTLFADLS